jgi:predicted DNA-binding WGR domain protein
MRPSSLAALSEAVPAINGKEASVKREFYYQDDRSNKFWTIERLGKDLVTTHGRIGSKGRDTRKQFETFSNVAGWRNAIEQQPPSQSRPYLPPGNALPPRLVLGQYGPETASDN